MLYYTISDDKTYPVVVNANHVWQARSKAAEYVNNRYDTTYSPSDFGVVIPLICDDIVK